MARDTFIVPTSPLAIPQTVRLGAGSGAGNQWTQAEVGKLVKLAGESRFDLCAAGDDIEGQVASVDLATQNGFSVGGVRDFLAPAGQGCMYAVADGLQATPGTGALAIGSYVVAGTSAAKGTPLSSYPKVCVATTPANSVYKWRVVSMPSGGAVGSVVVIKRVA